MINIKFTSLKILLMLVYVGNTSHYKNFFSYRYLNTISLILSLCHPVGSGENWRFWENHLAIRKKLKKMVFSNVVRVLFKHTTGLARHVLFVCGTCNSAPSHAHTLYGDACQKTTEIGSWNWIHLEVAIIPVKWSSEMYNVFCLINAPIPFCGKKLTKMP